MFKNKKIINIFASFGEEKTNSKTKEINNSSFLNKFLKRFVKQEKPKSKEITLYKLSEELISNIIRFTDKKCFSFYLNLEKTHDQFIEEIQNSKADRFYVFPLFPQYRSDISLIANFFSLNLYDEITDKFFWIKSYHHHPFFTKALQKNIKAIFKKNDLDEKNTVFLFLANEYTNDILYKFECEITCQNVIKAFQFVEGKLCFYNENFSLNMIKNNMRKKVVIIPITTLIDDTKTLKSIENIIKFLETQKKDVFICKTLNYNSYFIRSIFDIINEKNFVTNKMLCNFN
jgi:protoheme ferro-lyase